MSSNLMDIYFKIMISSGIHVYLNDLRRLPIYPATIDQQKVFIEKTEKMLENNEKLVSEVYGFKSWMSRTYKVDKFSKKLDKYYELTFDEFLNELKKKKVDIKPRITQEALKKEFDDSLNRISPLLSEIKKTDEKIDQMVYDLYGLNEDEIEILKRSVN